MLRIFISVLYWIYFTICLILMFVIAGVLRVFTFPFDPYAQIPNRSLHLLAVLMLKVNPLWSFKIEGRDKFKQGRPTVFVSNHQSFLDLPLAYLLPWKMKWVAKKELFRIPVLGWLIWITGHLSVDRSKRTSIQRLHNLVKPLQDKVPVMIFPEGTRSRGGKLLRFKSGAFMLAKRNNFMVQPIVMNGGYNALPSKDWKLGMQQQFHLSVLDPVNPDNFDSIDELKKHVRNLIKNELERIQKEEKA